MTGPIKILFIIDSLRSGGKERQLLYLIKNIQKNSEFVVSLVLFDEAVEYEEFREIKCDYHVIRKKRKFDLSVYFALNKLIRDIQPNVIHTWLWGVTLYASVFSVIYKIPLINGSIRYGKKIKIFEKIWLYSLFLNPFSKIVVANSKAGLKAHNKKESNKYRVIYNGIELSRSSVIHSEGDNDPENTKKRFNICMVARFNSAKDHVTAIKAVNTLIDKGYDVDFTMVGDGETRESVRFITEKKNESHFIFTGRRNDVEEFIRKSDVCILTCNTKGHAEGLSNSIMEYMLFKKPVIASDCGGNGEIISNERSGYIIEPFNHELLADKLEILINDKILRGKMGIEGLKIVIEKFSLNKMVEAYARLYKEVTGIL